ncbi:MAG TPA: hypothetical protein VMZ26_00285 [Pyrinomonadaceae bacterium]|nr:hypothetical protein [Pyrinomonadaceae bacterium]
MRRPRAKHGSTTVTQTGDSGPGRLAQRGKYFVNSGAPESSGSVVEPNTYYGDTLDRADNVKQIVTQGAGGRGNP